MAAIDRQNPRYLTSSQQNLLGAALVSNQSNAKPDEMVAQLQNPYATAQSLQGPEVLNNFDFDNSEFSNYLDGDSGFDFDNSELVGDDDVKEIHDKRKMSEDEDDDNGDAKRGEGEDKQPKKPGRKPLTSEPTTVRSRTL